MASLLAPILNMSFGWKTYPSPFDGREGNFMKQTSKSKAVPTVEQIAQMADKGKDISKHFTNRGKMMPAIRRVNMDSVLKEKESDFEK
jgi:hypothetical protein